MSGATVLLLVAMWALFLVPMLLRRHDQAVEVRSVDRFHTAMRILSRRPAPAAGARYVVMPARTPHASHPEGTSWTVHPSESPSMQLVLMQRRRRFVVTLLSGWAATLVTAVAFSAWFFLAHAVVTGCLVVTVLQLRRQAQRSAVRRRQLQRRLEREAAVAPPARRVPVSARPAVRHVDPAPAAVTAPDALDVAFSLGAAAAAPAAERGQPWSPVPVPPPTYVMTAGVPRLPRVVDLTKPGEWTAQQEAAAGWSDDERRAVND